MEPLDGNFRSWPDTAVQPSTMIERDFEWLQNLRKEIAQCYRGQVWLIQWYVKIRLRLLPLLEVFQALDGVQGAVQSIGSGFGPFEVGAAIVRPDLEIEGVELNSSRVQASNLAASSIPNLSFRNEDATKLLIQKKCDAIVMIDFLHHIGYEDQERLIALISKALRPGGLLIVKDLDVSPRWQYYWNYFHDKVMTLGDLVAYRSIDNWKDLLSKYRFRVEAKPLNLRQPYAHILLTAVKEA